MANNIKLFKIKSGNDVELIADMIIKMNQIIARLNSMNDCKCKEEK